jgi:Cellulose biosynthesis protein BcsS
MRRIASSVAALLLATGVAHSDDGDAAVATGTTAPQQLLFFSGLEYWRNGAFAHAGMLWSPDGLDRDGFTLKALGGAGRYRYHAGALDGVEVTGQQVVGALMPGWRFKADKLEVTAYAGLDLQSHSLTPNDPASRLRGLHAGMRAGADLWFEPLADLMIAASASVSSTGPGYWTRIATGWRVLDIWLGPEALALGDPAYRQYRAGLHATAWRTAQFEWSAGAGWVLDSDRRSGPYVRLGVLTRR